MAMTMAMAMVMIAIGVGDCDGNRMGIVKAFGDGGDAALQSLESSDRLEPSHS